MSLSSFSSSFLLKTLKKSKSEKLHFFRESEIKTPKIKQIGNYKLGQEIGSGAFGKVILGIHMPTGEKVAIKILDKLILSQIPDDYQLVKKEISILKIVKHKNIVRLYEIIETLTHILIVMEYCDGGDIMKYILTRRRLSELEALNFFQQLINALYYLHSQNIAHRDIKIDNLLLDSNMNLKLIDFGLSTKYRDDELLNQPCGTIVYAAPEVLSFREYHGMSADVWSAGVVLFGMLSGFLPFSDIDDEINKKKILKGNIHFPKFLSEEAKNLLKHMLDINPLTRYSLDDILKHPWFKKKNFDLVPGIIVGKNRIPLDQKILDLCVSYNMDKNKVEKSVINNEFNEESIMYYLLIQKMKKFGKDSISDLCSKKFINYILNESGTNENNEYINNSDKILKHKYKKLKDINLVNSNNEKKFIKIENNYQNNIIILDNDKKKKCKVNGIENDIRFRNNSDEKDIRKDQIDYYEKNDIEELNYKNPLKTDRTIQKGKIVQQKDLNLLLKKKKNKLEIRNKHLGNNLLIQENFKTIGNKTNRNIYNKEKLESINKNIFKDFIIKNKKFINLNNSSENNKLKINIKPNINAIRNLILNKKKDKNSKKIFKLKIKNNKIETLNSIPKRTKEINGILSNDFQKTYFKKAKIMDPIIYIPTININNKNDKEFLKTINNNKELYMGVRHNKSVENKKIIYKRKKNNDFIKNNLKSIYERTLDNANNSKIISNIKKKLAKEKYMKPGFIENNENFIEYNSLRDKKISKSNIVNLINDFKNSSKESKIPKNYNINNNNIKINHNNKNNLILNYPKFIEINDWENTGFNTERLKTNNIQDLKKNINNKSNILDFFGSNDYYVKKKGIKNFYINKNNISNSINKKIDINKLNNSIIQAQANNIKNNYLFTDRSIKRPNPLNFFDGNEKFNTSRISVKLRNKKLRKRNINLDINNTNAKINNLLNTSIINNSTLKNTIYISDNQHNNLNSLSNAKIKCIPYFKIREKITESKKHLNNIIINNNSTTKSSMIIYRKKSPSQVRDLSDSPRKKYSLNNTNGNKKTTLNIIKKGNNEKFDNINIYNKYMNSLQNNNMNHFKNKLNLKKINISNINNNKIKINSNIFSTINNSKKVIKKFDNTKELNTPYSQFSNSNYLSKSIIFNNTYNSINNPNIKMVNQELQNNYKSKKKIFTEKNGVNYGLNKKLKKNLKIKDLKILGGIKQHLYNKCYLTLNNNYNNV